MSIPIICNASHLSIMEKNEISFYKIIIYEDKVDRNGTVIMKISYYPEHISKIKNEIVSLCL